jgi:serine/threonine protein kinase
MSHSIGKYRLAEKIGEGSFCAVFKGINIQYPEDVVAVRIFKHSHSPIFNREIRTLLQLRNNPHPNLVQLFDAGEISSHELYNGYPYMIVEFMPDGSLADLIKNKGMLQESQLREIAAHSLEGLIHLHENDILHLDIHEGNIMFKNRKTKLSDFGLAKGLEKEGYTRYSGQYSIAGRHSAPEQRQGKAPDERTDIYQLGASLYFAATGKLPGFRSPEITSINPAISSGLAEVIYKALSEEPKDRFRTAEEMKKAIVSSQSRITSKPANVHKEIPAAKPVEKTIIRKIQLTDIVVTNEKIGGEYWVRYDDKLLGPFVEMGHFDSYYQGVVFTARNQNGWIAYHNTRASKKYGSLEKLGPSLTNRIHIATMFKVKEAREKNVIFCTHMNGWQEFGGYEEIIKYYDNTIFSARRGADYISYINHRDYPEEIGPFSAIISTTVYGFSSPKNFAAALVKGGKQYLLQINESMSNHNLAGPFDIIYSLNSNYSGLSCMFSYKGKDYSLEGTTVKDLQKNRKFYAGQIGEHIMQNIW